MVCHRTGRQLLHGEELGLVLPNLLPIQAVRSRVEVLCESFDEADVALCGWMRRRGPPRLLLGHALYHRTLRPVVNGKPSMRASTKLRPAESSGSSLGL
jgi:hypothetical protein